MSKSKKRTIAQLTEHFNNQVKELVRRLGKNNLPAGFHHLKSPFGSTEHGEKRCTAIDIEVRKAKRKQSRPLKQPKGLEATAA